jgi:4-hydroxy-tetrahydrodipicolinate synthase
MLRLDWGGLIPAIVLPMTQDAQIDEPALRRYVSHLVGTGVKALAVNADTGEGFARQFEKAGASALLVFPISAYQGEPLDREVPYRYHAAIADAVDIPLVLFNLVPTLGGVLLSPTVLEKLCEIDRVQAIKDASFEPNTFIATRATLKAVRPDVAVLTGNDNFIYESMELGADGALLGFGAVPATQLAHVIELALASRLDQAKAAMDRLQPLVDAIFAPPMRNYRARCKEALVIQGVLERATVREPLLPVSESEREQVRRALEIAGELTPQGVMPA